VTDETADIDAAWCRYNERIRAVGESITVDGFPTDPRLRAEGYRYVNRLANLAHQIYVEFGDAARPSLFRYADDITPFGATNTDNGEFVFGKVAVLAEASLGDLAIGDAGMLDLVLGGPERATNWLPLGPDAVYINIREFVGDWEHDALASLAIERIDAVAPAENLTPAALAEALDRAAAWVAASVQVWNEYAVGLRSVIPVNEITPPRPAEGGAVNMLHGGCQWDLGPREVLVVELDDPDVTYWSIQTYVIDWLQPLDFTNRVTSLNDRQVRVDDDGKVRVVLAHTDPGVQNWLDTSGLPTGLMSYRYVRPSTAPTPTVTRSGIDAVRDHLPRSTPSFSEDERREQIAARRRGVARRFRR
jgi:hypothetical protein